MQNKVITPSVFSFLKKLEKNNNRDWFTEHKKEYEALKNDMKSFFNVLGEEVKTHDDIERIKIFRIYRDVRFSKNKTPYKKSTFQALCEELEASLEADIIHTFNQTMQVL